MDAFTVMAVPNSHTHWSFFNLLFPFFGWFRKQMIHCLLWFYFVACDILWSLLWLWPPRHHHWADWGSKASWNTLSKCSQDLPCKQWGVCFSNWWNPRYEDRWLRLESFQRKQLGWNLAEVHWQGFWLSNLVETMKNALLSVIFMDIAHILANATLLYWNKS